MGEQFFSKYVERLRRNWPPGLGARDEPEDLAHEVVRSYEKGRYAEAKAMAERLVEQQKERLGEQHPDYATALSNLGRLFQQQGDHEAAEPLLKESLNLRRDLLGEHHPQYAASLFHLADLHLHWGELDTAEPLLRQAVAICKEALGESHPDYATGLTSLAQLLERRGDLSAAEPLLRQALEIRKGALGERHPMYATALSNLGLVLQHRGDLTAAEPLLREALELRGKVLGAQHPDYVASLSQLAILLLERKERTAAEPLLHASIDVADPSPGMDSPGILAELRSLVGVRDAPPAAKSNPSVPGPRPRNGRNGSADHGPETAVERAPLSAPGPGEIAAELRTLSSAFLTVGSALVDAARRMQSLGEPPDPSLLAKASTCQRKFAELRDKALRAAEPLALDATPGNHPGLAELSALMDQASIHHEQRQARATLRDRALAVLDRALGIRHRDADKSHLLRGYHDAASALRGRLSSASLSGTLPREADELVEGSHPIAALVALVEPEGNLSDEDWGRLYDVILDRFGKQLASATAQRRLVLPAASSTLEPPRPKALAVN